ncbi:MAG: hypothetical protein ACJAVB_001309 [Cyclobacteriaceae bacterium]|jgi:hypothetical protein
MKYPNWAIIIWLVFLLGCISPAIDQSKIFSDTTALTDNQNDYLLDTDQSLASWISTVDGKFYDGIIRFDSGRFFYQDSLLVSGTVFFHLDSIALENPSLQKAGLTELLSPTGDSTSAKLNYQIVLSQIQRRNNIDSLEQPLQIFDSEASQLTVPTHDAQFRWITGETSSESTIVPIALKQNQTLTIMSRLVVDVTAGSVSTSLPAAHSTSQIVHSMDIRLQLVASQQEELAFN